MVGTHMDHRIAMARWCSAWRPEQPVTVDEAAFIDTSFPGFAALMNGAGGALSPA